MFCSTMAKYVHLLRQNVDEPVPSSDTILFQKSLNPARFSLGNHHCSAEYLFALLQRTTEELGYGKKNVFASFFDHTIVEQQQFSCGCPCRTQTEAHQYVVNLNVRKPDMTPILQGVASSIFSLFCAWQNSAVDGNIANMHNCSSQSMLTKTLSIAQNGQGEFPKCLVFNIHRRIWSPSDEKMFFCKDTVLINDTLTFQPNSATSTVTPLQLDNASHWVLSCSPL